MGSACVEDHLQAATLRQHFSHMPHMSLCSHVPTYSSPPFAGVADLVWANFCRQNVQRHKAALHSQPGSSVHTWWINSISASFSSQDIRLSGFAIAGCIPAAGMLVVQFKDSQFFRACSCQLSPLSR